ncbi:integral membrane protein PTH11-like protein [Penicillium brasilianum]|uniref:Integral membrane protein PTH11-like protein n=1 Tax=Penicillium brasilianum TaxID=104259 RepID=A0A1S9R8Y8_PENBI|nr:integral membrane protein PTH11-like protein [Penicillium brasilianum]
MGISSDHGSQGPTVAGISLAFAVLTFFVLVLRLFARIYVLGKMGLDDYLIVGACCLSWAFIAVTIIAVENGLGQHYEYTDKTKLVAYAHAVWLSSMFYLACLGFVKTSVLWFYTRLGDRYLTRISYIMIGVIVCQATSFVLVAAFQCQPISKAWTGAAGGKCVNINIFYLANAGLNILTDLLTYTLPIRVIFKLQMPQKQKIALIFILCLGLFACVSSIIRITYIPAMLKSADYTYAISAAMYWSVIETNVAIFAASIPSFKAIASRFLPKFIGEYSSGRKYGPWSGTPDARRYGSGFTKFTDPNNNTMNGRDDIAMGTQIGATMADNSSEERIIVPNGKIFTQTEIETTVESNHEYRPSMEQAHRPKRSI